VPDVNTAIPYFSQKWQTNAPEFGLPVDIIWAWKSKVKALCNGFPLSTNVIEFKLFYWFGTSEGSKYHYLHI
jgi:hypothetical protein